MTAAYLKFHFRNGAFRFVVQFKKGYLAKAETARNQIAGKLQNVVVLIPGWPL